MKKQIYFKREEFNISKLAIWLVNNVFLIGELRVGFRTLERQQLQNVFYRVGRK